MSSNYRVTLSKVIANRAKYIAQLTGASVEGVLGILVLDILSNQSLAAAENIVRDRLREYLLSLSEDEDTEGAK